MTESFEHYNRAPIVEAIIEISIEPLDQTVVPKLEALGSSAGYPIKGAQLQVSSHITVGLQSSMAAAQMISGFIFHNAERTYAFGARLNGFSLSRLPPYDRWEPFRDEAMRLWDLFRSAIGACNVSGLGVRYINQVEIPANEPIERFLATYPEVARGIPQGLNSYFMRVEVPWENPTATLIIQQGLLPPPSANMAKILLDDDFRIQFAHGDDIWELLESARTAKNEVFEACIRDELRGRIR